MKQKTKKELRQELDRLKDLEETYDHIQDLHELATKLITVNASMYGVLALMIAVLVYQYFA